MRVVFFFGLAIADYASSSSSSSRPMMTATSSVPEPSAEALAALKHAVASLQPGFLGAWATDLDFLLRARREVASGSFVHFEEALHPWRHEALQQHGAAAGVLCSRSVSHRTSSPDRASTAAPALGHMSPTQGLFQ